MFEESYGLNWLGKSYARFLVDVEPKTFLKEDVEFNQKEENKDKDLSNQDFGFKIFETKPLNNSNG